MNLNILQSNPTLELKEYLRENPKDLYSDLDGEGGNCLHYAAWFENFELAYFLINDIKVDIEVKCSSGSTALHYAAYGSIKIVKLLLDENAIVDVKDNEGNTPLQFAVFERKLDIIGILLKAGANPHLTNNESESPLELAIKMGNNEIVRVLTDVI